MNPQAAFILAVTTIVIAAVGCIVSVVAHVPRRFVRASVILFIVGTIGLGVSSAWKVLNTAETQTPTPEAPPTPLKSPISSPPTEAAALVRPTASVFEVVPTATPSTYYPEDASAHFPLARFDDLGDVTFVSFFRRIPDPDFVIARVELHGCLFRMLPTRHMSLVTFLHGFRFRFGNSCRTSRS